MPSRMVEAALGGKQLRLLHILCWPLCRRAHHPQSRARPCTCTRKGQEGREGGQEEEVSGAGKSSRGAQNGWSPSKEHSPISTALQVLLAGAALHRHALSKLSLSAASSIAAPTLALQHTRAHMAKATVVSLIRSG